MKVSLAAAMILLACAAGFGQSNRSQYQDPQPRGGAPPSAQTAQGAGPGNEARRQEQMQMQEQMRQLQADLQDLQTRLTKLRADANRVRDPDTRAALLDVAEIWEQSVQRMQSNLQQMRMMTRVEERPGAGLPGSKPSENELGRWKAVRVCFTLLP